MEAGEHHPVRCDRGATDLHVRRGLVVPGVRYRAFVIAPCVGVVEK